MPDQRLFFGLYPTPAERARLHALTPEALRVGRRVVPENLHLTLVFLGACDEERERAARAAADSVQCGPVELTLDRVAVWRLAGVQVLLPPATPAALRGLYDQLRSALVDRGFSPASRPWVPHVTVARKVESGAAERVEPVVLRFGEFRLFRSRTRDADPLYLPVARWPLGGDAG